MVILLTALDGNAYDDGSQKQHIEYNDEYEDGLLQSGVSLAKDSTKRIELCIIECVGKGKSQDKRERRIVRSSRDIRIKSGDRIVDLIEIEIPDHGRE